jgi:soluble lytic murein transglycosylase-like protein
MAVLSESDVSLYRQIFADMRSGRFADADDLFSRVSDKTLEGYVLAERYLSPYGHASLGDLNDWLRDYPDLAIADRIYRVAVARASHVVHKRHHKTVLVMTARVPVPYGPPHRRAGGYEEFDQPDPPLSSEAGRVAQLEIERCVRADLPDQAASILRQAISNGVPDYDQARLAQRVAASYLAENEDQAAYDTAISIQGPIRRAVPALDWYAGFSAYRLGNYQNAADRLEVLAASPTVPNYLRSQAAFWAARAHMRFGDPQRVITLLTAAAHEQPSFYGLLAEKVLGLDTQTGFQDPVLTAADFSAIMMVPSARRAVALTQVGEERGSVPGELNRAFGDSDGSHDMGYAALARRMNEPNTELRAGETEASRGIILTSLFPVPGYRPDGGYTIDPALVLAFVRTESRFMPEAISPAGARGLMQLMPSAASQFGGPGAMSMINDPSYNMALGQRYVAMLLDTYNGNLVQVPAAYNAGSGRVAGWIDARAGKEDDALTFIESIRISETRYYVKRVLMYHWLYSRRMSQPAPTLDQTAAGNWPIYRAPYQPPAPPPPTPPAAPPPTTTVISDARY